MTADNSSQAGKGADDKAGKGTDDRAGQQEDGSLDPKVQELLSKKNQENASLRKRMKEYESRAASLDGVLQGIRSAFEVDTDEDLQEAIKAVAEARKKQTSGGQEDQRLKSLEKQLQKMQKDTDEWKRKYEDAELRGKREKVRTALSGEFGKQNAVIDDLVVDGLVQSGRVAVNESGSLVWTENDEEFALTDGVKRFLDARPYLVKASQRSGGGQQTALGGKTLEDLKSTLAGMTVEDYEKNKSAIVQALRALPIQ